MRVPQGPTLSFRIAAYTLAREVRSMQRRPPSLGDADFKEPPLLVLSGLAGGPEQRHVALMAEMFRHAFPPLDVKAVRLADVRRVALVGRNEDSGLTEVRHYMIRVQAAGLSKAVRKLVVKGRMPKMGKLGDVADLIQGEGGGAFSSDSEVEETPEMQKASRVTAPQNVQGVKRGAASRIRLIEVGPRLTLELLKVEAGLSDGEVLYDIEKTPEEIKEKEARIAERKELKRKRREEQNANVELKREKKRLRQERRRAAREQREAKRSGLAPRAANDEANTSEDD